MSLKLRVLSVNMWGLGFGIAPDRLARFRALGAILPHLAPDVVGVQEIWMSQDAGRLQAAGAAAGLPHHAYFRAGVVGSGLLILSRYPIVAMRFWPFRLSGHPRQVLQGDYYAGKGIGLARLQTPAGPLDVYNTHFVARYMYGVFDHNLGHRLANAYEAARFVNAHSPHHPAVVLGDFNFHPDEDNMVSLFLEAAGLQDSYAQARPDDPGYTATPDNPYSRKREQALRLDYICVRNGTDYAWDIEDSHVALRQRPSGKPYSDHYGVLSDLVLCAEQRPPATVPAPQAHVESLRSLMLWEAKKLQAWQRRYGLTSALFFGVGMLLWRRTFYQWLALALLQGAAPLTWLTGLAMPQQQRALDALQAELALYDAPQHESASVAPR